MVSKSELNLAGLVREDRIHHSLYTDQRIFDLEMDRIFNRSWVYIAHESEVAQGGDYKTTFLGRRPVIVTRNPDDGQVQVLFNRCRHRGATVCQFEAGNSSYFRCAYHGWTYNNTGKLVGVPYRQGYGSDFAPGDLALVPVARVETYQGLIFASMNPDVPDLSDYLGRAKEYIDAWAAQSPEGVIEVKGGITKYAYNGNWKMQMENTLDGYHFDFVHEAWIQLLEKRSGQKFRVPPDYLGTDLGNGHAVISYAQTGGPMMGPAFALNIFPNLEFLWAQIRVIRPIAPDRTEMSLYFTVPKGAPQEGQEKRLAEHTDFYSPVGSASPDDWEMFERCETGLTADAGDWVYFMRGYRDEESDRRGGPVRENEAPQRAFYRMWGRLMIE